MSVYQLNRKETWTLATLLNLPIQEGSLLGTWLSEEDVPDWQTVQQWTPLVLNALAAKGYMQSQNGNKDFPQSLLDALLLAAMGQEHLNIILRGGEEAAETRFTVAGNGMVQFGFQKDRLILHDPRKIEEMLPVLLPDWIKVDHFESVIIDLPLGAFLLFKQACLQREIAYVLNEDGSEVFSRADLIDAFLRDNGWLDVYHTLGLKDAPAFNEIPLADHLQLLLDSGYLKAVDTLNIEVADAGEPLAKVLNDPNAVSFTIGLTSVPRILNNTSVFMAGADRLMRLDLNDGILHIEQLESQTQGLAWLRNLLLPPKPTQAPVGTPAQEDATIVQEHPLQIKTGPLIRWQVEFITGNHSGKSFDLGQDMTLGRSEDNDITLLDSMASRKHARLERTPTGYVLQDLGSTNGTYLNKERLQAPTTLHDGDVIRIGDVQMRFKKA